VHSTRSRKWYSLPVACPWSVVLSGYFGFFQHYIWSPWYSWNIAESGINHQKSNQIKSLLKNEIVLYSVSCYIEVSFKAGLTILLYFEMLINSIFFLNITAVILISYRQKKLVFNTYIAAARKAHARIWIYYQEWQGLYFLFYSKLRVWLFRLINYSTSHLIKIWSLKTI
jgi:hypothetical protein